MLQVGQRDKLVEIAKPRLVLGQDDQVLGLTPGLSALAQLGHGGVDVLQTVDSHGLQLLKERRQHIGHCGRVIAGPVVVEGGQLEVLGHNVQLILAQLRQQVLGQNQAVNGWIGKGDPVFPAPGGDKAHVKLRVVGGQRPVPHEVQKGPQGLLLRGRAHQHLVGDAGEVDDLRTENAPGGYEGVKGFGDLSVFQHCRTDLDDDLPALVQAGGLNIKADNFLGKILAGLTVDHYPVVHVVDKVGLQAVEQLDIFRRMPGVREGLSHAVVGDGDGPVAPGLRPLHHVSLRSQLGTHGSEGVHGGHGGMQMELHPLFRGVVHAHFFLPRHHGHRLQHHIAIEAVHVQPSLNDKVHAFLYPVHQGFRLVSLREELAHPDGAGVVGNVKGHHPGVALFQLPVLDGKYVTLDDHHAHVQLQLPDGHRSALDDLAEDGPAIVLLLPFFPGGGGRGTFHFFQRGGTDGLRPGKGVLGLLGLLRLGRSGRRLLLLRFGRFGLRCRSRLRHLRLNCLRLLFCNGL